MNCFKFHFAFAFALTFAINTNSSPEIDLQVKTITQRIILGLNTSIHELIQLLAIGHESNEELKAAMDAANRSREVAENHFLHKPHQISLLQCEALPNMSLNESTLYLNNLHSTSEKFSIALKNKELYAKKGGTLDSLYHQHLWHTAPRPYPDSSEFFNLNREQLEKFNKEAQQKYPKTASDKKDILHRQLLPLITLSSILIPPSCHHPIGYENGATFDKGIDELYTKEFLTFDPHQYSSVYTYVGVIAPNE